MSFWPKSRYTQSLEQQIVELKAQSAQNIAELKTKAAQADADAKAQIDHERQQSKASEDRRVQQVTELRSDLLHERDQVSQLTMKLVEAVKAVADTSLKQTDKKDLPLPKAVNWLRARGSLEGTDLRIEEHTDKEKSANGSR